MRTTRIGVIALSAMAVAGCAEKAQTAKPKTAVERLQARIAVNREKDAQATLDHMDRMEGAKAIITAVIAASEKHKDFYPSPKQFKDWTSPFLATKYRPLLDSFEWTFPGGDCTLIDDVRNTSVGHLGEAVAYVDGSVRSSG